MTRVGMAELWQVAGQLFPILQQAVAELGAAPGPLPRALVGPRFVRSLRRHGLTVRPVAGLEATWLVNGRLWVCLVPAGADLAAQVTALRAAMRCETVQGGYVIGLGVRPVWRWVQTSAAPVAGRPPT